jgi:hypothetical protein
MSNLIRYDAMCSAIDAAYEVDEVKDIRDRAIALEVYSRQAHNVEAEQKACEIRLRAERKAGALLKKTKKAKGGGGKAGRKRSDDATALSDLGISKQQSSDWQKLADVPDQQFEAALADPTAKPTTAGIIRATAEPRADPVSTEASWLGGRLKDFVRNGVVDRDPADVMATMTPEMKDEVHTLAPRVAAWLRRIGATAVESMPESARADKSPSWRNLAAPGSLLKSGKKRGGQ